MDGFYRPGMSREDWIMSGTQTVIDYNHRGQGQITTTQPAPVQPPEFSNDLNSLVQLQLEMLKSSQQQLPPTNMFGGPHAQQLTSFGPPMSSKDNSLVDKYNPFAEDKDQENFEDMDISDEDKESQNINVGNKSVKATDNSFAIGNTPTLNRNSLEVKSGAAFYQGLILYIPPFEQLAHTYRGSPALKMLYASFEFSFKAAVQIETKPKENEPNKGDATIVYKNNVIATGSGFAPHVEASVRALELLSETCYTIQAKEDYFIKCKLVDAENMKTLNLKKWEAVSEKYPKIVEATKESHIQKTFAVFLDTHTNSGNYEDIVCCNLTRQDVNHIRSVVEFFQLTMLPCSISTNLSKKHTPCVVSIHKYTSAKKLLDILVECGGENDKFILHPPDTFKDFYKLHPNYWDPNKKNKPGNTIVENKTTLEDPELQAVIMKPYENVISELFEKHKNLPKVEEKTDECTLRKSGDDFMKSTFQIDMSQSKDKAPVERMQLLLKYMEQLQEYGSRVLTSGRADMIKIYHNAIENVRKDLEQCRKDIEKEQKEKASSVIATTKESSKPTTRPRSPTTRKRTPPRKRSKSPAKKNQESSRRSASPRRKARSKSPRRRRSPSPRRRPRSPPRRARSKSPRRLQRISPARRIRSPTRTSPPKRRSPDHRGSPPRRGRSPMRRSPKRRSPEPSRRLSKENDISKSIFKDQISRYMDILRRLRIEMEDTPPPHRGLLRDKIQTLKDQCFKFNQDMRKNPALSEFEYELDICREEIIHLDQLIRGEILGPNDLPPSLPPHHFADYFNQPPRDIFPDYSQPYPHPSPVPRIPSPETYLAGRGVFPY